ncbi:MAG: hypothetical protein ACPG7F_11205 [Aggregatilineales bacterium]
MAFMNQEERDKLLNDLKNKNFNQIKRKVRRLDRDGRLAYFRNVQESGKWMTRYVLEGKGTQVTLVEKLTLDGAKKVYELYEIIVEPTPENRL